MKNLSKMQVVTKKAPGAIGPYSQAVRVGNFLFCSGQIPLDPETGTIVGDTIETQTEQVMKNVHGLLESEGLNANHMVKTTVFLKNMGEFPKFNETYQKYVQNPYPARSTVEVARLPKDVMVEVECIAVYPNG